MRANSVSRNDESNVVKPAVAVKSVLYLPCGARRQAAVAQRLKENGVALATARDIMQALQLLSSREFVLCLVDLASDHTALVTIRAIRVQHPHVSVAALFDASNPLLAAEAIHAGAIDLLPWPFDEREAATLLANAHEALPVGTNGDSTIAEEDLESLVAQSPSMRRVTELVRLAARGHAGVCISGEPGTGRLLVARTIHCFGNEQGNRPFVVEDCVGHSPHELERRLFGAASAGSQSATVRAGTEQIARNSALCQARGGTLLLRNLVEAPARVQARLARLLRDREAVLINGKSAVIELDLQPMATFDTSVDSAVADGRLRGDLYKQIAQIRIDVPSLRRRREDIPLLAISILTRRCQARGVATKGFSRSAIQVLSALPWSGNVTELRTLVETLVDAVARPVIQLEDLLEHARLDAGRDPVDLGATLRDARARFERDCISAVLARHHGRVPEAAKALGIQRTNLYRKIRQLNVARSLLSARR